MKVRGRLDPGLEKPEEEREQGWVIRHYERTDRNQMRLEALRRTRPKDVRYPRHIDRSALQSRSFGGQDRPGPRTADRHPDWFLNAPFGEMRSKLDHQKGQTIDVGAMTPHPGAVPIELPSDKVVPLPQSGHQGLIVGGKEPYMLLLLTELSLQTIALKRSLVSQA